MAPHELPESFPLFPLPNVVLFPDTRLPLHMFEPRYRQMTADALAGDGVLGMVLIRSADQQQAPVPIYDVGCAGRIVESQKLHDGRYNLLLEGQRRFRIREERPTDKLYRLVVGEPLPDPPFKELSQSVQSELDGSRQELEGHLLELAHNSKPEVQQVLRQRMRELDPVQLVHALCFGLDCEFVEKQSLLETEDPLARCRLLVQLLSFRRAASSLGGAARTLN